MTQLSKANSRIATAKLTREEVRLLRLADSQGLVSPAAEAKRFGVGVETIRRALRGDTYQDVPFPPGSERAMLDPASPARSDPAPEKSESLVDPAAAASALKLARSLTLADPTDPPEEVAALHRFIEETKRVSADDIIN